MSNDNDSTQDTPIQPNPDEVIPSAHPINDAAKAAEVVAHESNDVVSATSRGTNDGTASISSESFSSINFEQLAIDSKGYENRPEEARRWLKKFGDLEPGTDVSKRLVATQHAEDLPDGESRITYPSILPVLTSWLGKWFTKAVNGRKINRSVSPTTKESEDLRWLFAYVEGYLSLPHTNLEANDLGALCDKVLDICEQTAVHNDIEHGITIIYLVLAKWALPSTVLPRTLAILCSVRVTLRHNMPAQLLECTELALQRGSTGDSIDTLCGFLNPSPDEKVLRTGSRARGAVLLMRGLLNTTTESGDYLVNLQQLLEVLLKGALQNDVRLHTEIFELCTTLVATHNRYKDVQNLYWSELMAVAGACAKSISTIPLRQSQPPVPPPSQQSRSASTSQYTQRYAESLLQFNRSLADIWAESRPENVKAIYEYFMKVPQTLVETQCILVIQFARSNHLIWPTNDSWEVELTNFVISFVQDIEVPSECRVKAVEVIEDVVVDRDSHITDAIRDNSLSQAHASDAISTVVMVLTKQLLDEKDLSVIRQLTSALEGAFWASDPREDDATKVIDTLHEVAMLDDPANPIGKKKMEHATRALGVLFWQSVYHIPSEAKRVFEHMVEIASTKCLSAEARLAAMRFLFRLRSDSAGFLYIQPDSESEYIAVALCRTTESAEAFSVDSTTTPQRNSASTTSLSQAGSVNSPLWMYPVTESLPHNSTASSFCLVAKGHGRIHGEGVAELDIGLWLATIISCLQSDADWETYSYILVHLGAQLANTDLFRGSFPGISFLRQTLCDQLVNNTIRQPPASSGLQRSDVAIVVYNILSPLIAYVRSAPQESQKASGDSLVRTFLSGVGTWNGTSRGCIHSLSICSLEIPESVATLYPAIIDKLSKSMTQPHLTINILEFLAQVARLPAVHKNFREEEIITMFGICIQFLEKARERSAASATTLPATRLSSPSAARHSGLSLKTPPYRQAMTADIGIPQYAAAQAYHTMIFWFLSRPLKIRAKYVSWIVPRLIWKNPQGEEMLDEQSQVFIDMMQRAAFSDLGETLPDTSFSDVSDGTIVSASWIVGMSIITVQTAGHNGVSQITKRQASGTTHSIYRQQTAETPYHHVPSHTQYLPSIESTIPIEMLPSHVLLQLTSSAAATTVPNQPISLPIEENYVKVALSSLDRLATVDSHKIGVLYVGEGQADETQFLPNTGGSTDYNEFLSDLGSRVSLEPPLNYQSHGLRLGEDGVSTIAWRDRVTEIVFLVPTLMPTDLFEDPQCIRKKAHVGNLFVLIIFNRSGKTWRFENFRSQLNYVNIVITPVSQPSRREHNADAARQRSYDEAMRLENAAKDPVYEDNNTAPPYPNPEFYKVHVLTKPGFPDISPAADAKIISAAQLANFVRLIALNADVLAQAWNIKDDDNEFPSSWRARLQSINTLRQRVLERTGHGGVVGAGSLAQQLDFSRYAV